ncbi:hypothetical protein MMC22_004060 [Lobaria immixta]|nr:hypothetical protein [Lobaria immixta]
MYMWKCCMCRIFNNSDLYHCPTCAHAECEFCVPSAGPVSDPNHQIPEPPRGFGRVITILKRHDLHARATAPSPALEQLRARQPAEDAQGEPAEKPADKPADTPAKEQVDQPTDSPTNQTPKNT